MGLLNRIASNVASQAIGKVVNNAIDNAMNNNQNNQQAQQNAQAGSFAKPSLSRKFTYFGEENGQSVQGEYTFSLSGDFAESRSNAAEVDALYVYDPNNSSGFTEYAANDSRPYFMVASGINEICRSVNDFANTGSISGALSFQPVNDGKTLFKAKFDYYGDVLWVYGFKKRIGGAPCGLCVVYKKGAQGTPLEAKLLAALDEAEKTLC